MPPSTAIAHPDLLMSKVKVNLGVKYEQKQKENDENGDIYFGDGVRWRQDNCCRILIIEHQPIVSLVIDHVDDEDDDHVDAHEDDRDHCEDFHSIIFSAGTL